VENIQATGADLTASALVRWLLSSIADVAFISLFLDGPEDSKNHVRHNWVIDETFGE
jgi:hypothetical protein